MIHHQCTQQSFLVVGGVDPVGLLNFLSSCKNTPPTQRISIRFILIFVHQSYFKLFAYIEFQGDGNMHLQFIMIFMKCRK